MTQSFEYQAPHGIPANAEGPEDSVNEEVDGNEAELLNSDPLDSNSATESRNGLLVLFRDAIAKAFNSGDSTKATFGSIRFSNG